MNCGFITIIVMSVLHISGCKLIVMCPHHIPHKQLAVIVLLVAVVAPLFVTQGYGLQLTTTSEYNRYVHTNISSKGNFTVVDKPFFPVMINNSQIQIGQNWTITCPLQSGHNYHAYFYGSCINTSSTAKTDYNIYVYNPDGTLDSAHTESAGFPEHLGTSPSAFFTPTQTGNYSFVIKNNIIASKAAQAGTFMIIENLETDKWQTSSIQGVAANNQPSFKTTWVYEFVTNAATVSAFINVPQTLDMYEARLYLMNNDNSPSLDSLPLPWEPGLYGNTTAATGGYNFDSDGYRGVAYESCEHAGDSMILNYTSRNLGTNLYHLVLIGEEGSGDLEILFKTQFGNVALTPVKAITRVLPQASAVITYATNGASLANATLSYSTDNWNTIKVISMAVDNQTCTSVIPGQPAGITVQYRVDAQDTLQNSITASGSYPVKQQAALEIFALNGNITFGGNITINGVLTPPISGAAVNVQFMTPNSTDIFNTEVNANGTFSVSFKPSTIGGMVATAYVTETQTNWRCDSNQLILNVKEPPLYVKYSLFILIGVVVACVVGGVVYFLKFRGR